MTDELGLKNANKMHPDLVAAGFHRVSVEDRAPKIKWGMLYAKMHPDEQKAYLENLASTMNHAAYLIQGERDQLNVLCARKEQQIQSMKTALDQNNAMIQGEVTRMNAERQEMVTEIARLRTRIRELEGGDHS